MICRLQGVEVGLSLPTLVGELPKIKDIGMWLHENKNEYFAEATYTTEEYSEEVLVPRKYAGTAGTSGYYYQQALSLAMGQVDYDAKTITKERQVVTGYKLTQEIENPAIRITATPKYQNLRWNDCHIAYVFSKIEIRTFYLFSSFRELNWTDRSRQSTEKWRMLVSKLKVESILSDMKHIADDFTEFIMQPIVSKYPLNVNTEDEKAE